MYTYVIIYICILSINFKGYLDLVSNVAGVFLSTFALIAGGGGLLIENTNAIYPLGMGILMFMYLIHENRSN